MMTPDGGNGKGSRPALQESMRQLEAAIHDARVAFDCIGLGEIERAHTCCVDRPGGDQRRGDRRAGRADPGRPEIPATALTPDRTCGPTSFPDAGLQGDVIPTPTCGWPVGGPLR